MKLNKYLVLGLLQEILIPLFLYLGIFINIFENNLCEIIYVMILNAS